MKKLFPFALLALLIAACSFEQGIHFNKDMSGHVSNTVDMTTLMAGSEDDDSTNREEDEKDILEKVEKLKRTEGISNVVYTQNTPGLYTLNYDFKDVASLNRSGFMYTSVGSGDEDFTYFELKGKKTLIFRLPDMSGESEISEDEMSGMGEMFTYNLKITSDRPVKSVKTKQTVKSKDDRSVEVATDLGKLLSKEFDSEITISFKK